MDYDAALKQAKFWADVDDLLCLIVEKNGTAGYWEAQHGTEFKSMDEGEGMSYPE